MSGCGLLVFEGLLLLKLCAGAPKSSVRRNLLSSLTEFHPVSPRLVFRFALFWFLLLLPVFVFDLAMIILNPPQKSLSVLSLKKKRSFNLERLIKGFYFSAKTVLHFFHMFGKSVSGLSRHLAKRYRPTL